MKRSSIHFSELAVSDILEQADWYELQSGPKLATRWDSAVTSTIVRVSTVAKSGALCRFKAEQLLRAAGLTAAKLSHRGWPPANKEVIVPTSG